MVLAIAAGFAVRHFAHIQQAPLFALLVGLIAAQFVPAKSACGTAGSPPTE